MFLVILEAPVDKRCCASTINTTEYDVQNKMIGGKMSLTDERTTLCNVAAGKCKHKLLLSLRLWHNQQNNLPAVA